MSRQVLYKMMVAALVVVAAGVGYATYGDVLSLDYLALQEDSLREYQRRRPWLAYGLAFVVYVAVTGLSIPGGTILSLSYGWFFGLARAVILVSFASSAGATVAFLLSRFLFRSAIEQRFGERLQQFSEALNRNGPLYLFSLRLIPVVPFFVINVVMGLTPLKVSTFWWVSQLGMLPATIVYVYAGSSVPTLQELAERGASGILNVNIVSALVLLGVLPLVSRFAISRLSRAGGREHK